ncbi:glutathione ABC transporter ATP-binding protein GsiA [Salmonella enterica subsp. enterica serovar Choleraesuis]|nr:glutathione ABC transporter ATP-binding protein GsiA [Salmonella enterica subsp. enterica serovar Choleraesuis]
MSGEAVRDLPDERVLTVENLSVSFRQQGAVVEAVKGVSFNLMRGETLAIVGESGSGKSVTALAIMRLLARRGVAVTADNILLRRRNRQQASLLSLSDSAMHEIRGADIAMIFQEPMTSLNPVFPVGEQIAEAVRLHQGMGRRAARNEALRLLKQVRIPDPESVLVRFPHQLSGGMRQRVMIAMALSCKPAVLIADEPTTALDVTVQAQILQLIRVLQQELAMGVIFITHDMGVVAEMADRVLVMHRGAVVESADVTQLFHTPKHPYTQSLLAAVPRLGAMNGSDLPRKFPLSDGRDEVACAPSDDRILLSVRDLTVRFPMRGGWLNRVTRHVTAVNGVSFELRRGETLALVGESGSGKSTTARALLRLVDIASGSICYNGKSIEALSERALRPLRRDIQCVFQDPYASLDPRQTIGSSIAEPLRLHGVTATQAASRVAELLERVGLSPEMARRYPHEFSGGQRQRICIARALALDPKIIIADEAVSALDVSVRAQVVNLLLDIQRERGVALLFIAHDMAVVERISHRVAVMYRGQIVETGSRRAVFETPGHPYTRRLMASVPVASPDVAARQTLLIPEDETGRDRSSLQPVTLIEVAKDHFVARHSGGSGKAGGRI